MDDDGAYLSQLAKRGAEVQVKEYMDEIHRLRRLFPGIENAAASTLQNGAATRSKTIRPRKAIATRKARKSSAYTPAMRKAVSTRMKRYWAKRRATAR